jgi:hypothetical protein
MLYLILTCSIIMFAGALLGYCGYDQASDTIVLVSSILNIMFCLCYWIEDPNDQREKDTHDHQANDN